MDRTRIYASRFRKWCRTNMHKSYSIKAHKAVINTIFKLLLYSRLEGPSAKILLLSLDLSISLRLLTDWLGILED